MFNPNPPAMAEEVDALKRAAPFKLPESYYEFLSRSNGGYGCFAEAYIYIDPIDKVLKYNRYIDHSDDFSYYAIGGDGGDELIAFAQLGSDTSLYIIPMIGAEASAAIFIGDSIQEILERLSKDKVSLFALAEHNRCIPP